MALFTKQVEGLALAARTLGLTHDSSHTLRGEHEGIPVSVRFWSSHGEGGMYYFTTVDAGHPVPLRMNLILQREDAAVQVLRSALGGHDLNTGHAGFDATFNVAARDPLRALALLRQPGVRDALLSVRYSYVSVSDVSSSITLCSWCSEVTALGALLNTIYRVADSIRLGHSLIPPSDDERRAGAALEGAAALVGLPCNTPLLEASGPRGRRRAAMRFLYNRGGSWVTEFEVRFPDSLNLGLQLLPQGGFWSSVGELIGTQDIKVGHAAFDAKFKVKGKPEDKVAELLTGQVADRILALHAVASELLVANDGVRACATGIMDDAPSLARSFEVVDGLASAISQRAWADS